MGAEKKGKKIPCGIWGHLELLGEIFLGKFVVPGVGNGGKRERREKFQGKVGWGGIPGGAGVGNGEVWRVFPQKN